jgi:hypothetical protein
MMEDEKIKKMNTDAYHMGFYRLADSMAKMAHDAFVAYFDEMGVTYTAAEAAEWLGGLTLRFLVYIANKHYELHGDVCTEEPGRTCFCGVLAQTIRSNAPNAGCPIARFVYPSLPAMPATDNDPTIQ